MVAMALINPGTPRNRRSRPVNLRPVTTRAAKRRMARVKASRAVKVPTPRIAPRITHAYRIGGLGVELPSRRKPGAKMKKPSAKQVAARKRFAAMARAGALKNPGKKRKASKKKRKASKKKASPRKSKKAAARKAAVTRKAKKAKRSRAGKKAAATRKRNQRKVSPRKRRKGSKRRKSSARRRRSRSSVKALSRQLKSIRKAIRKAPKRSAKRRVLKARYAAVSVRKATRYRRGHKGRVGGPALRMARAHGLVRVNPSLGGIWADAKALAPKLGVAMVSTLGLAWAGSMLSQQIGKVESLAKLIPESAKPYMPAAMTVVAGLAAFTALKMSKSAAMAKHADAVLAGAAGASALMLAGAVKVADPLNPAAQISLGKRLGLPIGEFVAVSGYVDTPSGRIAVNGIGEFVAVAGMVQTPQGPVSVDGMGEYVGLSGGGEGIFGLLPDHSSEQIPVGRDPSRGEGVDDGSVPIQDILDGETGLGGGIFGPSAE